MLVDLSNFAKEELDLMRSVSRKGWLAYKAGRTVGVMHHTVEAEHRTVEAKHHIVEFEHHTVKVEHHTVEA